VVAPSENINITPPGRRFSPLTEKGCIEGSAEVQEGVAGERLAKPWENT